MARGGSGNLIGAIMILGLAIVVIILAVSFVVVVGSFIGTGVGFQNYYKALRANVRLERPGAA